MSDIQTILKNFWGYQTFRPLQEEIINSVLNGKNTLALLPTGGGKSICFQVPALAKEGLCLVISPLIALMKDQVENLRRKNITAFAIYSGMSRMEVINTLSIAGKSNCKFLYVSPERLETNLFKEWLPAFDVNLIAVDEAHCISQWGYDFRPSYLRIALLREELPGIPVLALTASATEEVQKDICEKLQFGEYQIFRQSFDRPNISYSVFKVDSKINKIIDVLQKVPGTSIVYCKSRKRTKEISDLLNMHSISSDFYHAGLIQEKRNEKQEAWIDQKIRCIVCTNAFGMGIDKPDVRTVIHADIPDCLENYYQEAGRAGRDGKRSYAVLLYSDKDLTELRALPGTRFPTIEKIRIVYQAIMNYLQIPSGSGEGNYFDFDIIAFIKQFELGSPLVMASLKTLEQEGLAYFNEQVFLSSKVHFITGKQRLYEFENIHLQLEPAIKALLRTYEGIFDQPVSIHEKTLAAILRKRVEEIKDDLKLLQGFGIIDYVPQKDTPQLFLPQNRVRADDLRINEGNYQLRKKQFETRIGALLKYVHLEAECRSSNIASYFGDSAAKKCGICDNCLREKNKTISKEEFEKIHEKIIGIIRPTGLHAQELMNQLGGIKKEKAWKVIAFLQAEDKITVDARGWLKLK